uniref:Uncharacterized protein n=1 Tax=Panstrongylus lignarius TaxID=156445 RepID=A0A224Y412_9HEMI
MLMSLLSLSIGSICFSISINDSTTSGETLISVLFVLLFLPFLGCCFVDIFSIFFISLLSASILGCISITFSSFTCFSLIGEHT